jgi:hypothetical protein
VLTAPASTIRRSAGASGGARITWRGANSAGHKRSENKKGGGGPTKRPGGAPRRVGTYIGSDHDGQVVDVHEVLVRILGNSPQQGVEPRAQDVVLRWQLPHQRCYLVPEWAPHAPHRTTPHARPRSPRATPRAAPEVSRAVVHLSISPLQPTNYHDSPSACLRAGAGAGVGLGGGYRISAHSRLRRTAVMKGS